KLGRSMLSFRPTTVRSPMLKLDHKVGIVLLVALSVLANASEVLAQADAKPSRPLDLRPFAHAKSAAAVPKPRVPVALQPGDNSRIGASASVADDAMPSITGAVPAPDNAVSAGRPAKDSNITAPV